MPEPKPVEVRRGRLRWVSDNRTREMLDREEWLIAPRPWDCDREHSLNALAVGYTRNLWTHVYEEVKARLGDWKTTIVSTHLILATAASRATRNPTTNSPEVLSVRLGDMLRLAESGVVLHRCTTDDQHPALYWMAFASEEVRPPVIADLHWDAEEDE